MPILLFMFLMSCEKISPEELESYPVILLEGAFIGKADLYEVVSESSSYIYTEEIGYVFYPDNKTYHAFYLYTNKDNKGIKQLFTGKLISYKILNRSEIIPLTEEGYNKPMKISFSEDTLHLFQTTYSSDIFDWKGIRCNWPIDLH